MFSRHVNIIARIVGTRNNIMLLSVSSIRNLVSWIACSYTYCIRQSINLYQLGRYLNDKNFIIKSASLYRYVMCFSVVKDDRKKSE